MIIGTAGHIDHGKTTLVRALTGVDTDRLPEEKRRGITIELGFAPLDLEGVGTVGVVDVPGHEAFVRTMVAGASGIDVALLVVAADEGVMPQTVEHLSILDLLGTRSGVVALTKCDLVDDDWLALVTTDVRDAVHGTPLEGAAIVRTSASTGVGLDDLRSALKNAMTSIPARETAEVFRMPVDRAFTVRGTGHGCHRDGVGRFGRRWQYAGRSTRRQGRACSRCASARSRRRGGATRLARGDCPGGRGRQRCAARDVVVQRCRLAGHDADAGGGHAACRCGSSASTTRVGPVAHGNG